MKYYLFIGLILSLSCKTNTKNSQAAGDKDTVNIQNSRAPLQILTTIYYWKGNINSNIPIFIWAAIRDSLIQGEVTYIKAKNPAAIKLLGRIDKDGEIKICEYQKDGNITGVFVFTKISTSSEGIWASTKNDKEYKFQLTAKDTLLKNIDTGFQAGKLSGEYSYAYGEKGYQGGITVTEIQKDKIVFDILSVTRDPSRNIAQIETDTVVVSNNEFIYKVPDSDSCIFKVKFFKDFVFIAYVKDYGDCGNVFGLNATVDGIFYRTTK
jgi:hypothetical protein